MTKKKNNNNIHTFSAVPYGSSFLFIIVMYDNMILMDNGPTRLTISPITFMMPPTNKLRQNVNQ